MAKVILLALCVMAWGQNASARYLGQFGANELIVNSDDAFNSNSVNNPFGRYGSPFSNDSANSFYATNAPKLYDRNGRYRGRLSDNPYDPESISNPYGRYGSEFSSESINNPYGAGSEFNVDSPNNMYGRGLEIWD